MTEREALKLALEALEEAWYHVGTFQPTEKAIDLYDEARTAIKEALAQPETLAMINPQQSPWREYWEQLLKENEELRAQVKAQRKTLTDEEIKELYGDNDNFRITKKYVINFARAIEAAHGIKGLV